MFFLFSVSDTLILMVIGEITSCCVCLWLSNFAHKLQEVDVVESNQTVRFFSETE